MDDQDNDPPATPTGAPSAAPPITGTTGTTATTATTGADGWRSATVGGQWPTQVVDTIDGVVAAFRLQVIRPLMLVARGLVFGIVVGTMALILSVLLSVALVRLLTVYVFGGRVWASYFLLAFLFAVGGTVAWSQRHSAAEDSAEAA